MTTTAPATRIGPNPGELLKLTRVDGTEVKEPIERHQEDDAEIDALARLLFNKAADAAAEIAAGLAARAATKGEKIDDVARRVFVARGLRIGALALAQASEMLAGRSDTASRKAGLP